MSVQETPLIYDVWAGLWLIAQTAGRDIIVDRPRAPVYLNMYLVLAAESGITRKSTAVRSCSKLAKDLAQPYTMLLETKITPEKLMYDMSQRSMEHAKVHTVIAIDEMVTFFGREKYSATMPGVLTDLYDCPASRVGGGSLTSGHLLIRNSCTNLLTASTPTWLMGAINPDIIEGGFTSRTIFIVEDQRKELIAWPSNAVVTQDELASRLRRIRTECEHFKAIVPSEDAKQHFINWYRARYVYRDAYRASFDSREDAHVLKCAALLSINDGSYIISKQHIAYAIKLVGQAKDMGAALFESAGHRTKRIIGLDKLRDALIAAGSNTLKRSELALRTRGYLSVTELHAALDIMHELGYIQRFTFAPKSKGRPAELYRATRLLAARTAVNDIDTEMGE